VHQTSPPPRAPTLCAHGGRSGADQPTQQAASGSVAHAPPCGTRHRRASASASRTTYACSCLGSAMSRGSLGSRATPRPAGRPSIGRGERPTRGLAGCVSSMSCRPSVCRPALRLCSRWSTPPCEKWRSPRVADVASAQRPIAGRLAVGTGGFSAISAELLRVGRGLRRPSFRCRTGPARRPRTFRGGHAAPALDHRALRRHRGRRLRGGRAPASGAMLKVG